MQGCNTSVQENSTLLAVQSKTQQARLYLWPIQVDRGPVPLALEADDPELVINYRAASALQLAVKYSAVQARLYLRHSNWLRGYPLCR